MALIDFFLLIPLLWFGFKGAKNGAIKEVTNLVAIIIGVVVASRFSHFLGNFLNLETGYAGIIYFAITFIVVIGMLFLAGRIITKFIHMIMLGWLNRILGVVFAVAKTMLILSVVIFYFNKIDRNETILPEESRNASLLFRPIERVAPVVMPRLMQLWQDFRTDQEN